MKKYKLKNVTFHNMDTYWKATGECYDNPKFYEGQYIHTSAIKHITANPPAIHTQNSVYSINKKDLPAKDTELWNLLYGVELKGTKDALHQKRKPRKVRKNTK